MVELVLQLPTVRAAFEEARQQEFQRAWTPVVYNARMEVGVTRMIRAPESEVFPVFRQHYERMCLRVLNGQALPHKCYARAVGLVGGGKPRSVVSTPVSRELAAESIAEIRRILSEDKGA